MINERDYVEILPKKKINKIFYLLFFFLQEDLTPETTDKVLTTLAEGG